MTKANILFIRGLPDDGKIKVTSLTQKKGIHYQLRGSANIASYLNKDLINPLILTFDRDPKQELEPIPAIHAIFNEISDADTHKITLAKTQALYNTFSEELPFYNAPDNVKKTTRDNIYQLLQGIDKLHVPKTVRLQPKSPSDIYKVIEKEGFEYPVIFRQAGDHGGISTIKLDDTTEEFFAFPLDGRDYYLTQFVDTVKDGIYTKYRLVVVDGKVYLVHALFSENWLVHGKTQLKDREADKLKISNHFPKEVIPLIQPIVTEIYNRLELDYFGIDCHIDNDMNLLAFEINVNMNIFIKLKKNIFKDNLETVRKALITMLTAEKGQ